MYMLKCDKCGKLSEPNANNYDIKGFTNIRFVVGFAHGQKQLHVCDECRKALRIPDEKPNESIAERFLEIIGEIVADELDANYRA